MEGLVESGQLQCLPVSSQAYLIGNTKLIWPLFCDWLVQQYNIHNERDNGNSNSNRNNEGDTTVETSVEKRQQAIDQVANTKDPFDVFCDYKLKQILQAYFKSDDYEIFWAHGGRVSCCGGSKVSSAAESTANDESIDAAAINSDFLVCMQRAAQASGLCWNDTEGTKMCVHPQFGAWKAYRAVVMIRENNEDGTKNGTINSSNNGNRATPLPPELPCPVLPQEIEQAKVQMQKAIQLSSADGSGVDYGASHMTDTAKSLCKYLHHSVCNGSDWEVLSPSMLAWIDLRDCITLGREEYKYSDAQLLYHYTKDPTILKQELERCLCEGSGK